MLQTFWFLLGAALLEVGGDALTRVGLGGRYLLVVAGGLALALYGILVNQAPLNFGRLMGAYIAMFFVTSQVVSFIAFRDLPSVKSLIGGTLIVAGGVFMIV